MGKSVRVTNGKETLEIDSADLNDAVKDGYHPTERIIVANPKTKQSYEIAPEDYQHALRDGFNFTDVVKHAQQTASPQGPIGSIIPAYGPANQRRASDIQGASPIIQPVRTRSVQVGGTMKEIVPTVAETHQYEVEAAQSRIDKELQNSDAAIGSLLKKNKQQELSGQIQQNIQNRGIDATASNIDLSRIQNLIPKASIQVGAEEIKNYRDAMQQDPNLARAALYEHANLNPDKAKQIAADTYLLDSKERAHGSNTGQILKNKAAIENGENDYSIWHGGQVKKPEGFAQSLGRGFTQRTQQFDDYKLLQNGKDDDIIKEYEKRRTTPKNEDEPEPVAAGFSGGFGQMMGAEGPTLAKGALPGVLDVATGGGATPAVPWLSALLTSPDFYERGYANSFNQNYNELRDAGHEPAEALRIAKSRATFDAAADVAVGAAMSATGAKMGAPASSATKFTPGFLGAVKGAVKEMAASSPEAVSVGALGGLAQAAKNIHSGKAAGEGIAEATLTPIAFHFGIKTIGAGAKIIGGTLFKSSVENMAKQPEEQVNKAIGEQVENGEIGPEKATEIYNVINEKRQQNAALIDKAKEVVSKGNIKGVEGEPLQADINDPEKFDAHLKHIADQAHDPKTAEKVEEVYGKDLVDIAKQLHPSEDVPTLIEANRKFDLKEVDDEIKKLSSESTDYGKKKEALEKQKAQINDYYDNYGKHHEEINAPQEEVPEPQSKEEIKNEKPQQSVPFSNQQIEAAKGFFQQGIENGTIDKEYEQFGEHPDHLLGYIKQEVEAGKGDDMEKEFGKDLVTLSQQETHYPIVRNIKPKENAIQQSSPAGEIPRPVGAGEDIPSSGEGVRSSEQGNETTGTRSETESQNQDQEVNPDELPFTGRTSESVGIAHGSVENRATEAPILQPERGQGVTVEEAVQHGRTLLAMGEDADKAAKEFQADKKISYDALSLVRAKHAELAKATNEAVDKFGDNSPQAKAAGKAESDWYKDVVKPMQTEWSKIGQTQQGETDIDTGTVSGLRRAYQEQTGQDFTPEQAAKAKELATQVKALSKKVGELEKKLSEAHDKEAGNESEATTIKEKAKKAAAWIRKGKSSPPGSFSAATPLSLIWDGMVEAAAKIVEAGGTVAEAINAGIKHLKDSEWYKGLTQEKQQEAEQDFENHINANNPDIRQRFANKTDNKFNTKDAKAIWDYAKSEYLDKGSSYINMINNTSKDLGLSPEQVRNAITQPKGTKVISDEIYRQNLKRTDAINEAKRWIKTNDEPALLKLGKMIPNFFFGLKVFGHGTVGMITHAGTNIFRPSQWTSYWRNFGRQFDYAFGGTTKKGLARYAKAMEDLKNHPDFIFWKRAGLAVDPKEVYDEYQGANKIFTQLSKPIGKVNKFIKKTTQIGDRGFNALKMYRMDMAKQFYDGLSLVEKADPNTAKEIAKIVNHATGTSEIKLPGLANTVFFAPKLEAARWQGLITDPAKAAHTFVNWRKSTPAQKVQAKIVARKAGEIIATWGIGLAVNQGLLTAIGSKQKINFTDPSSPDWLKFKAGDKTVDVSGGMESTMRFIASLINEADLAYTGTKKELREKPGDKNAKTIGTQVRYKLSPFMSTVVDLASGTDAMGRPLPYSHVAPKKGDTPHTFWSYIGEQQLPIPIAEGIKSTVESMKARGMSTPQIKDILGGIASGVISGGTGAKVSTDRSLEPKTEPTTGGGKTGKRNHKK